MGSTLNQRQTYLKMLSIVINEDIRFVDQPVLIGNIGQTNLGGYNVLLAFWLNIVAHTQVAIFTGNPDMKWGSFAQYVVLYCIFHQHL